MNNNIDDIDEINYINNKKNKFLKYTKFILDLHKNDKLFEMVEYEHLNNSDRGWNLKPYLIQRARAESVSILGISQYIDKATKYDINKVIWYIDRFIIFYKINNIEEYFK